MSSALVSIIMPAYNAANYIKDSIQSVLDQDYANVELLIVNDGSRDKTKEIIAGFSDDRIQYYEQENQGVSAARNIGLNNMKGDFFCFLDADDVFTPSSISDRVRVFFEDQSASFVDGGVLKYDAQMKQIIEKWRPSFKGNPLTDLLQITGNTFMGPTWLIRRQEKSYSFDRELTHGEDLLFFMKISRNKDRKYAYVKNPILKYRIHSQSAMRGDLRLLEQGYRSIHQTISKWPDLDKSDMTSFLIKIRSIMFKSYLRRFQLANAIKALR